MAGVAASRSFFQMRKSAKLTTVSAFRSRGEGLVRAVEVVADDDVVVDVGDAVSVHVARRRRLRRRKLPLPKEEVGETSRSRWKTYRLWPTANWLIRARLVPEWTETADPATRRENGATAREQRAPPCHADCFRFGVIDRRPAFDALLHDGPGGIEHRLRETLYEIECPQCGRRTQRESTRPADLEPEGRTGGIE
jgi:hypothetical protein